MVFHGTSYHDNLFVKSPAMVAWSVEASNLHSVEVFTSALGGSNPTKYGILIVQKPKGFVPIRIAGCRAALLFIIHALKDSC